MFFYIMLLFMGIALFASAVKGDNMRKDLEQAEYENMLLRDENIRLKQELRK